MRLIGHTESVEDVVFKPNSAHELCSVSIDQKILFWDTRVAGNRSCQNQAMGNQPGKENEGVGSLR